jgi:hypothetical protein
MQSMRKTIGKLLCRVGLHKGEWFALKQIYTVQRVCVRCGCVDQDYVGP